MQSIPRGIIKSRSGSDNTDTYYGEEVAQDYTKMLAPCDACYCEYEKGKDREENTWDFVESRAESLHRQASGIWIAKDS